MSIKDEERYESEIITSYRTKKEMFSVPFLHACAIGLHVASGFGALSLINARDPRTPVVAHYVYLSPESSATDGTFQPLAQKLFTWRPVFGLAIIQFIIAFFHALYFWLWKNPPPPMAVASPLSAVVTKPPFAAPLTLPVQNIAETRNAPPVAVQPPQNPPPLAVAAAPAAAVGASQTYAYASSSDDESAAEGSSDAPYLAFQGSANSMRWFEYAVTQTMFMVLIAAALGVQDAYFIVKLIIECISVQAFGWVLEKLDSRVPREAFAGSILLISSFIVNFATVSVLAWAVAASKMHSINFALCVLPIGFQTIVTGYIQTHNFYRQGGLHDPAFAEKAYILTSIMGRLSGFWTITTAHLSALQDRNLMPRSTLAGSTIDLDALRIVSIVVPPSLLLFVLTLEAWTYTPPPVQRVKPPTLWQAVRMGAPPLRGVSGIKMHAGGGTRRRGMKRHQATPGGSLGGYGGGMLSCGAGGHTGGLQL